MKKLALICLCIWSAMGCVDSPADERLNRKDTDSGSNVDTPSDRGVDRTAAATEETATDTGEKIEPNTGGDRTGDGNGVKWKTDSVTLTADEFYIEANGTQFFADVAEVDVTSDPGASDYCTLELIWIEHGVEMRLFIYFTADENEWWSNEIRTYSGPDTMTDWIYYTGEFFKAPRGSLYRGDVDLVGDRDNPIEGSIHFRNLTLDVTFSDYLPQ